MLASVLAYEALVQTGEWVERRTVYKHALKESRRAGAALVVVGCPKWGLHHGTGDMCLDLHHPFWCRCTNPQVGDIQNMSEMFPPKSIVVYSSHVLEHLEVDVAERAIQAMEKVAIAQYHCWPSKASIMGWLAPTHRNWPHLMQNGEFTFERRG